MTSESVYLFSAVALLLPQYPHRSSQLILPISRITAMASHNAPAGSNVVVQKAGVERMTIQVNPNRVKPRAPLLFLLPVATQTQVNR